MNVAIILAAGEGTRMKSKIPKVLHPIAGEPMLRYVVEACANSGVEKTVVIVGHRGEEVKEIFRDDPLIFRDQPVGESVPYGTGFAVAQGTEEFDDEDTVFILTGDTPLIRWETIDRLGKRMSSGKYAGLVLTALVDDPFGYGRIIRGKESNVERIVEERDATEQQKAENEVNSGIFVFKGGLLKEALNHLSTDNSQGELYVTDVVKILVDQGHKIGAHVLKDTEEMLGVNSRVQLARCEEVIRRRINEEHMMNGVTMPVPEATLIEKAVKIGRDTVIHPGTVLQGNTVIGEEVVIYGSGRIVDSVIGDRCVIENSVIESSQVGDDVKIGPFAHLRPGSEIGNSVKIGNFVEVKNSSMGDGAKAGHLAYIGDAKVGKKVNIGCGVITVNYNGKEKFNTEIGDQAFIGSNANLVAPISIGEGAYIAAGSTITKPVKDGALSIERSEQRDVQGYALRKGLKK